VEILIDERLRSSLGQVYGLGSARQGARDWWLMRLTSLALIVLSIWWIASILVHAGARYAEFIGWVNDPITAVLMILTIGVMFYHLALGVQTVIEDYVHHEWVKIASLIAVKFGCILLGAIGIFAVLRIALVG
jgi:succinate dehydrogenase / fumarate reductase membrane anchor subunit